MRDMHFYETIDRKSQEWYTFMYQKNQKPKSNGSMKNLQCLKEVQPVLLGEISNHISKMMSLPLNECICKSLLNAILRLLYLRLFYGKITHLWSLEAYSEHLEVFRKDIESFYYLRFITGYLHFRLQRTEYLIKYKCTCSGFLSFVVASRILSQY